MIFSSSREISTPSLATGLIPLYSGGLCDAVIIIPPLYPSVLVANSKHGVGTRPARWQSRPAEFNVEQTILEITLLEYLPSYPTSIGPSLK